MHFSNKELTERYYKVERELRASLIENGKLKQKIRDMKHSIKTAPSQEWYLDYLMKANASLERECDDRQAVIEQYMKHYQKYGKFYTEYNERTR